VLKEYIGEYDEQRVKFLQCQDVEDEQEEAMKLLLLNTKSRLIGESDISRGTVNASVISPRELFVEALQKDAVSIILLHNHPSGDPAPSREDILITRRVHEAGMMIGVELLDHIIIGDNRYSSMREAGILK
jgi:DNA repair protein RadC